MSESARREPPYEQPAIEGANDTRSGPEKVVHEDDDVHVVRRDCIDYGERNSNGYFDYLYRYAIYSVQTGRVTFRGRRYADEWHEVSLYAPDGAIWQAMPYDDGNFARAVRYFLSLEDVQRVTAFIQDAERPYTPVDPQMLRKG